MKKLRDVSPKVTRNTAGLQAEAKRKSEGARKRALEAINRLAVRNEPITFQSVAREAAVSTAYLYKEQTLRNEIDDRREKQRINTIFLAMEEQKRQVSDKSKDVVIGAKNAKIMSLERDKKDLQLQISRLKRELEVVRGKLLEAITA